MTQTESREKIQQLVKKFRGEKDDSVSHREMKSHDDLIKLVGVMLNLRKQEQKAKVMN